MMFISGQRKILAIIAAVTLLAGIAVMVFVKPSGPVGEDHGDEHGHDEHGHGGTPSSVAITPAAAKASGVAMQTAGPAKIATTATAAGSIVLDPAGHARIAARFNGVVRDVRKSIGDSVTAGETLASVDSNESLQSYQVKSPIAGVVIARNRNGGELAGDEPLFEVANLTRVWAEVHIFPRALAQVQRGQRVLLATPDGLVKGEATLDALLPVAEASSQSVVGRIALDNADGRWRPGMAVHGRIVTAETEVPVAVRAEAIQVIDGKSVVFVAGKDNFEVRAVFPGASDGQWIEVQEGLYADEVYAAAGSYLFKAELGKASAEHEH